MHWIYYEISLNCEPKLKLHNRTKTLFCMNYITHIGLAAGLLLLIGLILWHGAVDVLQVLLNSGFELLWLPLAWLPSLMLATQGWRVLLSSRSSPSYLHTVLAMWMGRAVNNLLPVATIGGEIAKARLITLWGTPGIDAAASVMVDKVMQAASVALWGLVGVICLLLSNRDSVLAMYALSGFVVLAICAIGFFHIQKAGLLGMLSNLGGKLIKTESWEGISFNAREIDAVILDLYQHRQYLLLGLLYRSLALALETAEVWLACYLLGYPLGLLDAIMLRSLTSTLRDVAFVIPNGYGIQEGAFVLIGGMVGIDPSTALAVSLAIRIRDIILDPAGLMTLHHIEARHYTKRKREKNQPGLE